MRRYLPVPFQGFGKGLNLRDKPDAVDIAECIDAMNVLFTDRGAIQNRPGYEVLTDLELTNRAASLTPFYTAAGTKQLLAGCGTRLEALSASGALVASATGLGDGVWDFARFGDPNEETVFAGNGANALRMWDGSAWSSPNAIVDNEAAKAMPKASALCVQPFDNRLVCGGFTGPTDGPGALASSPSHVYWSEPGEPQEFDSLGYVQFTPGDGERVMAVVPWREFVFVFKETKFFVIYDMTSSEATEGHPEAIYRPIETGVGLASPRAICVHPTGVYFMSRHGIYRTTGEEPVEVSHDRVEPIWTGDVSPYYQGGTIAHGAITNCVMETYEDLIYLAFPTDSTNNRVLIYDPQNGWFSLADLPAACMAVFRSGTEEELVFGYATGAKHVARHSRLYTNDAGAAIEERWRSGWFDFGDPSVKKIRGQKFWGTGKVRVAIATDFEQSVGTQTQLDFTDADDPTWNDDFWEDTFWASPKGLNVEHRREADRGTTFSVYFGNNELDQDFSIHRIEHLRLADLDPAKEKG